MCQELRGGQSASLSRHPSKLRLGFPSAQLLVRLPLDLDRLSVAAEMFSVALGIAKCSHVFADNRGLTADISYVMR